MAPIVEKIQEDKKKVRAPQGEKSLNNKVAHPIIKTSKVGKIKTEVRKTLPPGPVNLNIVKRKYTLNKKNQINKLLMKNKKYAPKNTEYKTNSVVMTYSPAVFKEAVKLAMDEMTEGNEYETDSLIIEVKNVRDAEEVTNIIVDKLISLEVKSKDTTKIAIKQQIHVYNTTQSIMVQGSRLINGIKGYKVLVEDFLHPHIESKIKQNEDKINSTKLILDNVEEIKDTQTSEKKLSFQCDKCSVMFKSEYKLKSHKKEMHEPKENKFACKSCEQKFETNDDIKEHMEICHSPKPLSVELAEAEQLAAQDKSFNCNICKEETTTLFDQINHMEMKHQKVESKTKCVSFDDVNQIKPKTNNIQEKAALIIRQIQTSEVESYEEVSDMEEDPVSLKRVNSTSPAGTKGKNIKISPSSKEATPKKATKESTKEDTQKLQEVEEDLNNAKKDIDILKVTNVKLVSEKESLEKDKTDLETENSNLRKRLHEQEAEVVKAMQDISDEVDKERIKINKTLNSESKDKTEQYNKELKKQKREQENKYNEIKKEKDKMMDEMVAMQTENDLMREKIQLIEKEKKIHKNMKLFNVLLDEVKDSSDPDECVNKVNCEGDCNAVADAVKLHMMKKAGVNRTCPQEKPLEKPIFKCDKCDFISQNKTYFTKHVKDHNVHDNKIAENARNISGQHKVKGPCSYYKSQNGCKKGNSCLWDHSEKAQAQIVKKIPKLCQNKETCSWKPRCKYVHPEDGESLPIRDRQERVPAPAQRLQRLHFPPQAAPQGHQEPSGSQGFGHPDVGHHPPGWTQIPPPIYRNPEQIIENITKQIQEMVMNVVTPNLMSLTQFPNLRKKQSQ